MSVEAWTEAKLQVCRRNALCCTCRHEHQVKRLHFMTHTVCHPTYSVGPALVVVELSEHQAALALQHDYFLQLQQIQYCFMLLYVSAAASAAQHSCFRYLLSLISFFESYLPSVDHRLIKA